MSWWRQKRFFIPVGVVVVYATFGFFIVPRVAKAQLEARLPALLNRPVTVQEVAFNPFALAVTVRGFAVQEKAGGPFVAFDELFVDASFWRLVRGRVAFDAIRLSRPTVSVTLLADGSLSFADLLAPKADAPPPEPEKKKEGMTVTIDALDIAEGAFTFHDQKRAEPFSAVLRPLALSLRDFTTEAGRNSQYSFTAKLGDATLSYEGDFSATPLRSAGKLSMQGIHLDAFQPYVAEQTQLEVRGGVAGIAARYELDGSVTPTHFLLDDGLLTVDGLSIGGEGVEAPLFTLARLGVKVQRVDLARQHVEVQEVVLEQGVVRAVREKSGALELARLAKRDRPAPTTALPTVAATPPPAEGKPWTAALGRFALQQWAVSWADQALEYPVTAKLDQLDLEVTKLRWPLEGAVDSKLAFRWMDSGRLSISGPVTPEPLGGALRVELTDFSLAPFDGYLWEYALNGTLKSGALTSRLDATFSDGGQVYAARGDVALRELKLLDGDDRPLLDARALELTGLDVRSSPALAVSLATVKLAGTTLRVERDDAGGINLATLAKAPKTRQAAAPPPAPEPKEKGPGLTAKVGLVQLEDLNVDWLDRTTKPAFATAVKRLSGKITNVTSPTTQRIGLALGGRLDQAPFTVKGAILPRGKASDGAIALTLTGYDLPRASPYSVQYVSQPIARGKIGVELDWKLGGRKVTAANHVLVDQLDFGPVVEDPGPDAKQLPLGLAVAVLSDRSGRIDLELPMSGDLDDPEFQWGGMILSTLKNLLEKVATAPFTLVAGLFAGDPESLKAISFPAGEAQPVTDEAAKADTLAKLLTERPLLKLELTPGVDPVADRDVIARRQLRQSLGPRGGAALERSDAGVPTLDDAEYQRLVGVAWRKVNGADAGAIDFQRMESELLARQVVSEESLEGLRRERAAWLQGSLGDRGVDVTRLFVVGAAKQDASNVAVQLK